MRRHFRNRLGQGATAVLFAMVLLTSARAEDPHLLPPVTVSPPPVGGTNPGTGVGVGTGEKKGDGDAKTFERLNQELKRKADEVNPTTNSPPIDARSPDTRTGVVNIPAVQQQYGKNFGVSAVPFRPPPPIYSAPLGHR